VSKGKGKDDLDWAGDASDEPEYSEEQHATLDRLYRMAQQRLSVKPRRLGHSRGVARCARRLASSHGVDPFLAEAAGILHDWDKILTPEQLWAKVDEFGIRVSSRDERMAPVLHGMTAAASLSRELDLPAPVFQAIARHTLGAPDMTALDIVVYCSDMLEPGRGEKMDGLRGFGRGELPALFAVCAQSTMAHLIGSGRYVSVESVATWNACCADLPADAVMGGKRSSR
jgi:predicted HD superfamily hydrolase involved in NAD metabolism